MNRHGCSQRLALVLFAGLWGGCATVPSGPPASPPAEAQTAAPATPAQASVAEAKPEVPQIREVTVKPSGVELFELEAHGPYDYVRDFEFDVRADALTEVWIRVFGAQGTDDAGKPLSGIRMVNLCDPNAPTACDAIHVLSSDQIIVGVAGTRRVKFHLERSAPKRITVQVVTDRKRLAWTDLLLGAPAEDAKVADRDLTRHGVLDYWVESSWTLARRAFTQLPKSFVIYATTGFTGQLQGRPREIAAGEPLLVVGGAVLRANGERVAPRLTSGVHLDMVTSATRPAKLVMPPAWVDTDGGRSDVSMYDYPYGDDTAEFAGFEAPELDAFLKAREPVKACIGRELAKRGSGYGYDVALYKKDGTIKKVQSLTSYIEEQVYKKCQVGKLDKRRTKLRNQLRARALEEIATRLESP